MTTTSPNTDPADSAPAHRRRPRYAGKHPRRFEEKYKERDPLRYPETIERVLASGKTPAGAHRPIMVTEALEILAPKPGEIALDCTVGYGGHAQEILTRLQPGGRLLGMDVDPIELPKTEARLRDLGFGADALRVYQSNFAGLAQILAEEGLPGVDIILADLGVSSMQLDDPSRGFSTKYEGPLDMRMNPKRGQPASALLQRIRASSFQELLEDGADEPRAAELAVALAGRTFSSTGELAGAVRAALPALDKESVALSTRRVFQALRIAVNDEFSALEMFLRRLPDCLNAGGRAAILTFHSGEDRRVKKAFEAGLASGAYSEISDGVVRPSAEERRSNPRSTSAKLRWAKAPGEL
ncbi:MAG TPA: 16S rRNA (cytosine(1402)-N(4))-methyltransferase RsmH [Verrucomicrobiae bacterium]|nr:16S rRNA (cytosine(1402)-N(4))-methyltransferase RsmH [Verrucomicrobiae bacterium]